MRQISWGAAERAGVCDAKLEESVIPLALRHVGNRRRPAPGTEVFYDKDLLPRLAERHKRLTELAVQMRISTSERAYAHAQVLLRQFARIRGEQVLDRNVNLYAYARGCLRNDEVSGERLLKMRRALSRHTKVTGDFVRKYLHWGIGSHNAEHFHRDVEYVKAAVKKHEIYGKLYFIPLYESLRFGAQSNRTRVSPFLRVELADA